ncbi:MAG: SprT-like domain-containing protein [Gammaproteobacteria bacterium]
MKRADAIQEIEMWVRSYVKKARKEYGSKMAKFPDITIRHDLKGVKAGQALWGAGAWCLRFNIPLLAENTKSDRRQTAGHEVAHLIVNYMCRDRPSYFRFKPHGEEWKSIMVAFGLEAERCHYMDIKKHRRGGSRFIYACDCDNTTHRLTPRIHNDVQGGSLRYCVSCKCNLVPVYDASGGVKEE